MKIIGIILRKDDKYYLNKELVEWLLDNNVIPIGIPSDKYEYMIKITKECDGVILQGGNNYNDNEIEYIKYLYNNNIPTLGICLGMQLMALAINGTIGNINNHNNNNNKYVHNIKINRNTKLYKIVKQDKICVNSRHNDSVKSTTLKVAALSKDGVIEAIEEDKNKFFIGIQWHPESLKDENSKKILKSYLESL